MAIFFEDLTPDNAWSLVHDLLGNGFSVIEMYTDGAEAWGTDKRIAADVRQEEFLRKHFEIIGKFYLMIRRLSANGHNEEARKIRILLDMITDLNVASAAVREQIHDRHCELQPGAAALRRKIQSLTKR